MFYVYEHIRHDTGNIFYVGKGSRVRMRSKNHRNAHWHSIVKKAGGYSSKIIASDGDEELMFLAEEERIDQLRRLGLDLANKTDGGWGGTKGYRHTDEAKQKISEKLKGKLCGDLNPRYGLRGKNSPTFGLKQSDDARRRMSENSAMRRAEVVAKISGERSVLAKSVQYQGNVYKALNDLAMHLGISSQALRSRIFRGQAEKYGYEVLGHTHLLAN